MTIMKRMKQLLLCGALFALSSCESIFDTESTSVIIDEGQMLDSPNDSLYSAMGILSQVRNLGEKYVLLGELRGDLMTVSADASESIAEISSLQMTVDNDYASSRDFYAVINNCNYALARLDTAITIYQNRVLVPEYAAIKTLRDWTYWQMALAYGDVAWIEKPLLSAGDATASYPRIGIEEVARRIISDLTPFTQTRPLDYGTIDGYASRQMFYPVQLLLGDMYLFLNQYAEAAQLYYDYIRNRQLTVSSAYANNWKRDNRSAVEIYHTAGYLGEMICGLMYSSDPRESHPSLVRMSYNEHPQLLPAATFTYQLAHAMHFYAEDGALAIGSYLEGDLRGQAVGTGNRITASALGTEQLGGQQMTRIHKYLQGATLHENGYDPENTAVSGLYVTRMLPLVRVPHVYLRLAEALNRLGKPSMAFAILKYGLTKETLDNPSRVAPWELESGETFLDFSWLSGNTSVVGTAARGLGRGVAIDAANYIIPATCLTRQDSILAVEDYIVDEMAAETAFEGNRFFDLMRVARHRDAFPAYMADKVSVRFDDANAARIRLQDAKAWFLKRKDAQ